MSEASVRILLVDDHRMIRNGLRLLIQQQPNLTVVGEETCGQPTLDRVKELQPHLVLMDVDLPDGNGIQFSRRILAAFPQVKILILSAHPDPAFVNDALQAGVSGYILKEDASEELTRAIRAVMSGLNYLSPQVTTAMVRGYTQSKPAAAPPVGSTLSEREQQVLKLLAVGRRNKEVAVELGLSTKSVETYRSRLMAKTGCSSAAELVRYALREGLTQL